MIILAIDGSTKSTGIAIFNNNRLIYQECIQATSSDMIKRVIFMSQRIRDIAIQYPPTDIIMEEPLPQEANHNQATFKALMYLQAAVAMEMKKLNKDIHFYVANHWRKMVGIKTGRYVKRQALKEASIALVKAKFDIDVNDDIADAINIGLAYFYQNGSFF